ncbi:MAG: polysaccharide pyruvyl transferase family protein, partial [Muribaculaceae bacterium]|nr:polysaccharide pyruvyl transferase family protein [Muribaculaceae bacterium]
LCYLIGYSFNPFPYADEVIKKIKRATGYKVVMIAGEPINILRGYKVMNDCTPEEFLNLFYNASYVITSSFHGTAFAINFGIPFTSIVDNLSNNDNRQTSLISKVGMGSHGVLRKDEDLTNFIPMKTSDSYAPLLEECRESSQRYLLDSLKLINKK